MEEKEFIQERYELTIERIGRIADEKTVSGKFRDYFQKVAVFLLQIHQIRIRLQERPTENCPLEELQEENKRIYQDILGDHYQTSYANPEYAVLSLGEELGKILCFLYAEIRGEIAHVYEGKLLYLTIYNELFIEIYNCFENEEEPNYKEIRNIIYWFMYDYCDVFLTDWVEESFCPEKSFLKNIILQSDLSDLRYLYKYGEYISEREWNRVKSAADFSEMCMERFTQFDAKSQSMVQIQCVPGLETGIRRFIENFEKAGINVVVFRRPTGVWMKPEYDVERIYGLCANREYEEDHREDQGIFLNKKMAERRLEVVKNSYEQWKDLIRKYVGTVAFQFEILEKSVPVKKTAVRLSDRQKGLVELYQEKLDQLTRQYVKESTGRISNKYLLQEVKSGVVDIHKLD